MNYWHDKAQQEVKHFWAALMFYTRMHVPQQTEFTAEIANKSRLYLPLVGVLVGIVAAIVLILCQLILPFSVSLALSMVATILLTGALHEDGFADSCDGFGGGWDKTQVLTIMKDSRVGTYATVGMIGIIGLKFLSLYELGLLSLTTNGSLALLVLALINGHSLSRLGASLAIEKLQYVQDLDSSKIKSLAKQPLSTAELLYSALFTLPALGLLFIAHIQVLFCLAILIIVFYAACAYFNKRIGGFTGDCLGALQQVLEVSFYLSLLVVS